MGGLSRNGPPLLLCYAIAARTLRTNEMRTLKLVPNEIEAFLRFDDVISIDDNIRAKSEELASAADNEAGRAKNIFDWVRDHIPHSKDIGEERVTCTSIEVFAAGTGICFPKSHLLASMMRHVGIPCGFCYQVFENPLSQVKESLALHGLNAIKIQETGAWHRIDPRGNRDDIHAVFSLEEERLAFPEMEFLDSCVYSSPIDAVVAGLRGARSIEQLWPVLPSVLRIEQDDAPKP